MKCWLNWSALDILSVGFAFGIVLGRLGAATVLGRFSPEAVTLSCAIVMCVTTLAVLLATTIGSFAVLVFLAGIAMAPVFPTTIATVGRIPGLAAQGARHRRRSRPSAGSARAGLLGKAHEQPVGKDVTLHGRDQFRERGRRREVQSCVEREYLKMILVAPRAMRMGSCVGVTEPMDLGAEAGSRVPSSLTSGRSRVSPTPRYT